MGQRPDGTETLDTHRLTAPRQLDTGDIVGIRDGGVVAISPDDPVKATSLGQATAWFPSVDKGKVWAVTEQTAADCEGRGLPTTVRAKHTVADTCSCVRAGPSSHPLFHEAPRQLTWGLFVVRISQSERGPNPLTISHPASASSQANTGSAAAAPAAESWV